MGGRRMPHEFFYSLITQLEGLERKSFCSTGEQNKRMFILCTASEQH